MSQPVTWGSAIVGALVVGIGFVPAASTALAQEDPDPVVHAARIVVDHANDGESSVEATYELGHVPGDGIEHLLVHRPGVRIHDVSVDGASVDAPEHGEGLSRVGVPVSGEQVSYTIAYTTARDDGEFAVPILIPDAPRDASDRAVSIEVLLPPGMVLSGEAFPSIDSRETRDGREVVLHSVINVPTVVIAEYGERGRFSLSDWITAITLLVFAIVVIFWYRQSLTGRTSE